MLQKTPRKYTKPSYTKNYLRDYPRLDRKKDGTENDIRIVGITNWRDVARERMEERN
jgi:hypothetical protein